MLDNQEVLHEKQDEFLLTIHTRLSKYLNLERLGLYQYYEDDKAKEKSWKWQIQLYYKKYKNEKKFAVSSKCGKNNHN